MIAFGDGYTAVSGVHQVDGQFIFPFRQLVTAGFCLKYRSVTGLAAIRAIATDQATFQEIGAGTGIGQQFQWLFAVQRLVVL